MIAHGAATADEFLKQTGINQEELYKALKSLEKDSMVAEEDGLYQFPKI
jgi:sugar-specific transcriptional regulator TrmB